MNKSYLRICTMSLLAYVSGTFSFTASLVLHYMAWRPDSPDDAFALDRVRQTTAPSISSPLAVFKAFIERALKHPSFTGDHYALE